MNRAIGMLVDQGHDIEHAHQLLRSDAARCWSRAARLRRADPSPMNAAIMINSSTGSKININLFTLHHYSRGQQVQSGWCEILSVCCSAKSFGARNGPRETS
jgi:hypothetical protein